MLLSSILMILLAYLLGSINSAVIVSHLCSLPDPRSHGSKNPGTTNVLRLGGKKAAALVLFFDLLKGTLPVWSAYYLNISPFILGLIAISACLGHMFPIFFGFKGGKGVATALGTTLPIGLDLASGLISTWLIVLFASGYSSLSALVAALVAPFFTYLLKPEYTLPVAMMSCLIILRHHGNIARLIKHQETGFNRIDFHKIIALLKRKS